MAVVPICYKMYYKDQTLSIPLEIRRNKGCFMHYTINQEVCGGLFPVFRHTGRRERIFYNATGILTKANIRDGIDVAQRVMQSRDSIPSKIDSEALDTSSREKQLRSLDSYFGKLRNDVSQPSSSSLNNSMDLLDRSGQSREEKGFRSLGDYLGMVIERSGQFEAKEELGSADDYIAKVNEDVNSKDRVSNEITKARLYAVKGTYGSRLKLQNNYMESEKKIDEAGSKSSYDETSGLYLISIMASINIAVFLFEIASPIRNSDLELFSLPSLYGAKINHLILIGEWWRLVTPMFLHSGILHIGLGCWVLLTFGPQVCRAYGPFTFFLIYILGGISGNLTSFLHTPDPTVGGTGPVFAIIGAWLIYQYQNRDAMGKDAFESMFQKAIVASALGVILSTFGPIDDWTHFGAAFTGIAYGFFTCPTLQMDDASSETGQEDGISLIRRNIDPCKSLLFFSLFILVLGSLLFIVEPPLSSLAIDILI